VTPMCWWRVSIGLPSSLREPASGLLPLKALLEVDGHSLAGFFADRPAQVSLDGQLVGAVAERRERAAERVAVDTAPYLDQASGAEELGRARHDHVGPTALGWALLQRGGELFVPLRHSASRRCDASIDDHGTGLPRDGASWSTGPRHGDWLDQHDAVGCAAAGVVVGHDVQRAAVLAAEHAREATAVGTDGVELPLPLVELLLALVEGQLTPVERLGPRVRRAPAAAGDEESRSDRDDCDDSLLQRGAFPCPLEPPWSLPAGEVVTDSCKQDANERPDMRPDAASSRITRHLENIGRLDSCVT
jgi:hypothetical protein